MGTPQGSAERVAGNVRQLREARGLSHRKLTARLSALGQAPPIAASGLVKIEQGQRRVTAEELVLLALALGVTPNRLLLPARATEEPTGLAPAVHVPAVTAWWWATGEQRLPGPYSVPGDADFSAENRPHNPPDTTTLDQLRQLQEQGLLDPLRRVVRELMATGHSPGGIAELAETVAVMAELDEIDAQVQGPGLSIDLAANRTKEE